MGSVFWKAIAIELYSLVPHSMTDERTMSAITLLNTAQRNRQLVPTVVAMAQVLAYYMGVRPQGVSVLNVLTMKSLDTKVGHPNPVFKFYDVERLVGSIDDDGRADNAKYDESDDEEDVELDTRGPAARPLPAKASL